MEKGSEVRPEAPPSDNLYVSELPTDTSEEALRKIFGPGVTQCKVLPPKVPGGNCVALVRFSSVNEATIVRETLNGAIPPGHSMPVCIRFAGKVDGKGNCVSGKGKNRSEPYPGAAGQIYQEGQMMDAGACGGGQIASGKPENPPSDNLYITGLPLGLDNDTLKAMFSQYGVVSQCKVLDPRPGATASHALVRFSSVDESTVVKKALSGYIMQGLSEPLIVEFAIQKEKGGDKGGDKGWKGWKGCEKGGCDGVFWDELTPQWAEGKGWKGDGWKGDGGCKGEASWKGATQVPAAWKGEQGGQSWKGGDTSGYKGAGGKGSMDGGKGFFFSMENVLQGFAEARCLPGQGHSYDENALHISGLPPDCDDVHLYKLLGPFGAIPPTGVKAMKHPDGTCKGFGFVNFIDPSAMEAAMQMLHGTLLPDGTVMNVTVKQPGKGKEGKGGKKGGLPQPALQNG